MNHLTLKSEVFTRGVETIVGGSDLERLLGGGKQLRIKHGIDATGTLHIGHAVSLRKLRQCQEAGHRAVILLGDFTTRIGDPTGKSKTRPTLAPEVIEKNIRAIEQDIKTILLTDKEVFELRRNSEWWGAMAAGEFLRILSLVTHARLIEREMFQRRLKEGAEIFMHEFLYPILQGYDSVMLTADMTIVGSDQLFNEHFGRFFQDKFGQHPQAIVSLKLLPGLDGGEKMSKSLGNAIFLADSPEEKFGKAMRMRDELILSYLEVYTDANAQEQHAVALSLTGGKNPMEAKLDTAEMLVRTYHTADAARAARKRFLKIFSLREIPEHIPEMALGEGEQALLDVVVATGRAGSRSEARRLIQDGAVEVDGVPVAPGTTTITLRRGMVLRIGKKTFIRVRE